MHLINIVPLGNYTLTIFIGVAMALRFHVKELENIGLNQVGQFFRQITQLPFGYSCSTLLLLPSHVISSFVD